MNIRNAICHYLPLAQVDYLPAWDLQRALAAARAQRQIGDVLVVLEHPHTYTLGRVARREHLLLSEAECQRRGIQIVEVDRGGDITYHGPGQLVAYPVRYLGTPDATSGRVPQVDYVGYIRRLEELLIRTVDVFGIEACRVEGYSGAWVDAEQGCLKIGAIGVRVNASGVSTHGVALNVSPDLSYFGGIIPCGIADKGVTSMHALLGDATPSMEEVRVAFIAAFERVFGCVMVPSTVNSLLGRVTLDSA